MATANKKKDALFEASYADLSEGPRISVIRLRQLLKIVQDDQESDLWPLVLVNAATCMEWFGRTVLKHLIDYAADRVNPDARILRDLKLNYASVLQAHTQNFSIGDIVATSRNFSSFDDLDGAIEDLMKTSSPSVLARVSRPWGELVVDALHCRRISKRAIAKELNIMFRKRNELVHGSPRHLSYSDQLSVLISREELARIIHCSLQYIRHVEIALKQFIPHLQARSTHDNNANQYQRLSNSERELRRLETAVELRLSDDPGHLLDFKKAQRAWKLWRSREGYFQTGEWGPGTGRTAILMGYETTLNMERLRSLEAYVRELDNRPY